MGDDSMRVIQYMLGIDQSLDLILRIFQKTSRTYLSREQSYYVVRRGPLGKGEASSIQKS